MGKVPPLPPYANGLTTPSFFSLSTPPSHLLVYLPPWEDFSCTGCSGRIQIEAAAAAASDVMAVYDLASSPSESSSSSIETRSYQWNPDGFITPSLHSPSSRIVKGRRKKPICSVRVKPNLISIRSIFGAYSRYIHCSSISE